MKREVQEKEKIKFGGEKILNEKKKKIFLINFSALVILALIIVVLGFSHSFTGKVVVVDANEVNKNLESNFNEGIDSASFEGYIIEFKEPSVIEKKTQEENKIKELKIESLRYKEEAKVSVIGVKQYKESKASSLENLAVESQKKLLSLLKEQKTKLSDQHKTFLSKTKVSITGKAISNTDSASNIKEYTNTINAVYLNISSKEAEEIKKSPEVKAVYPNMKVQVNLMDSVPLIQDGILAGQLDKDGNDCVKSGKECLTGKNITIAIIDTGIDYTHPDLGGCFGVNCKVVGGWDFVNNDSDPIDDQGHGTHCAGIAAGNGVLKGVAPEAKLYAYKVLDSSGSGYFSDIIAGIERAVDPNQDGNFSDHLDIISMSLGGPGNPNDPPSKAVDSAVDAGVSVVVAAGNSGPNEQTIGSPGTARKAITVGAVYKQNYPNNNYWDFNPVIDQITSFSSRGPVIWINETGSNNILIKPDIVAPGALICSARYDHLDLTEHNPLYSTCIDDRHILMAGTSMATPMVAGSIALIKQAHQDWNSEEIKSVLKNTAIDLKTSSIGQGAGRINITGAIEYYETPKPFEDFFIFYEQFTRKNIYNKLNLTIIVPNNYTSLILEWRKNGENSWRGDGLKNFIQDNNILIEFSPNGKVLETGYYEFRAKINVSNIIKISYATIYFDKNLKEGFPKKLLDTSTSTSIPILSDINKDGKEEIITFSNDLINILNSSASSLLGWPKKVEKIPLFYFGFSPAIGDIDGDFKKEIVRFPNQFTKVNNRKVCGFVSDEKGNLKNGWTNDCPNYTENYYSFPSNENLLVNGFSAIYNLDNDKKGSILFKAFNYSFKEEYTSADWQTDYIFIVNGSSDIKPGWPISFPFDFNNRIRYVAAFPKVIDVNNDGYKEIIILLNKYFVPYKPGWEDICNGSTILIYNFSGKLIKEIEDPKYCFKGITFTFGPTLINDNGKIGLLYPAFDTSSTQGLLFVSLTGEISFYKQEGETSLPSVFKHLNNLYFAFSSNSNNNYLVHVVNSSGEEVINWPKKIDSPIFLNTLTIADINGEEKPEILGISLKGTIYAWDLNGNLIKDFPIYLNTISLSSPAIGDVDGDSKIELVVGDTSSNIYVWDFESYYNNSRTNYWSMFQHDPQQTGCYDCDSFVNQVTCTDSDGGNNIYVAGTTKGSLLSGQQSIHRDRCIISTGGGGGNYVSNCSGTNCAVDEAYCKICNESLAYCGSLMYQKEILYSYPLFVSCPNGCINGSCLEKKAGSCEVLFNESSPLTYPGKFKVYTNCNSAFKLYRNEVAITNNSIQFLAAGNYNFTVKRNDNQNYTNTSDTKFFSIKQLNSIMSYYINGDSVKIYLNYGQSVNASVSVNVGSARIYRNGKDVTTENNKKIILASGYYNYEFNSSGNVNYTGASTKTIFVGILNNTGSCEVLFNATSPMKSPAKFKVYTNCNSAFKLSRGNIAATITITNNSVQALAAGTYNFTVIRTDKQNYTNVVDTKFFTVI